MLSDTIPPGGAYDARVRPLRGLAADLRDQALPADLVTNTSMPHVAVRAYRGCQLTVTVERGRFRWGVFPNDYPLLDPFGCTRRIATSPRKQRGSH